MLWIVLSECGRQWQCSKKGRGAGNEGVPNRGKGRKVNSARLCLRVEVGRGGGRGCRVVAVLGELMVVAQDRARVLLGPILTCEEIKVQVPINSGCCRFQLN